MQLTSLYTDGIGTGVQRHPRQTAAAAEVLPEQRN
jgi:hypothetical protein